MTERAIEAAWRKVMSAQDMPHDDDPTYDRWLFEAAIRAYHAALAEDDATVEKIGTASVEAWSEWQREKSPTEFCRTHVGRAAIRAMGGE